MKCEACERGDHENCGMQTWCECDCAGPDAIDFGEPARRTLSDGTQIYPEHRNINPQSGQQLGYVVLAEEERAKGFVRPVRYKYRHLKCGGETTINSQTIAETCARDPHFYSGTFCCHCRAHFPVGPDGEFVWSTDGSKCGT